LRVLLWIFCVVSPAWCVRIGDLDTANLGQQLLRFFTLSDPSLRYALAGSALLGFSCGLLGAFVLLRRMAMMGDTLGHSVLPGVVFAFAWTGHKDVPLLLLGACLAGLAATISVAALERLTPLKADACMGLVLSSYFALGIVGLTRLSKSGMANQSGLDKFLFGQAAALGPGDLWAMAISAILAALLVGLAYKELLVVAFDPGFAQSIGVRVAWIHGLLMAVVTVTLVTALQAVGAVLVSAMLVTPAASAYLLTDRLKPLLGYSVLIGIGSGLFGTFLSFMGSSLPTGPCMVLSASLAFGLAWFFSPRHGWVARMWRQHRRQARIGLENTLKDIFLVQERGVATDLKSIAQQRQLAEGPVQSRLRVLQRHGLVLPKGDTFELTPEGEREARRLVRNHRLWELFLTNEAQIAADHVHRDAEEIEHLLSPELVAKLEALLGHPVEDPHGSPIP